MAERAWTSALCHLVLSCHFSRGSSEVNEKGGMGLQFSGPLNQFSFTLSLYSISSFCSLVHDNMVFTSLSLCLCIDNVSQWVKNPHNIHWNCVIDSMALEENSLEFGTCSLLHYCSIYPLFVSSHRLMKTFFFADWDMGSCEWFEYDGKPEGKGSQCVRFSLQQIAGGDHYIGK